uniref:Uncharacterized protein n=1 Tax=Tetraselmis chuii TaxID=63592 RepID=A0A7S1X6E9_9CHLO|mmetsp:Transcript_36024/g.64417  ORF Transcript_36024/g.64417 Transcript_36024/m.64417 type:complete len:108 (+) Transcript_36024:2-325(+)
MREWGVQRYKSIVVNHGNAQNHAHMHLKVWMTQEEFDRQLYSRSDLAATVGMLQAWVSTLPIEAQGRWRQQNSMGGRRGGRRGRGGYPSSQHGRDRGQHPSKMQRRS